MTETERTVTRRGLGAAARALALACVLGAVLAAAGRAEEPSAPPGAAAAAADVADERATAFRAVEGPEAESISGGTLLLAAYAVIWLLVCGYVWRIGRLQAAASAEVATLAARLGAAAKKPDGGA